MITRRNLVTSLALSAMAGGAPFKSTVAQGSDETFYYVPKFTGFIFFQLAEQGAKKAADELGVKKVVTLGTAQNDVQGYVQILQNLLPQRPQILVTTSSDANAPVPVLKKMRANGAVVVTLTRMSAPTVATSMSISPHTTCRRAPSLTARSTTIPRGAR